MWINAKKISNYNEDEKEGKRGQKKERNGIKIRKEILKIKNKTKKEKKGDEDKQQKVQQTLRSIKREREIEKSREIEREKQREIEREERETARGRENCVRETERERHTKTESERECWDNVSKSSDLRVSLIFRIASSVWCSGTTNDDQFSSSFSHLKSRG